MFSYDRRDREDEICENILVMPIWTCQAAKAMFSSLEEKKHWTEGSQSKKNISIRYRKCVYFNFCALVIEFVKISINRYQQNH